jgi:hypothetical protein
LPNTESQLPRALVAVSCCQRSLRSLLFRSEANPSLYPFLRLMSRENRSQHSRKLSVSAGWSRAGVPGTRAPGLPGFGKLGWDARFAWWGGRCPVEERPFRAAKRGSLKFFSWRRSPARNAAERVLHPLTRAFIFIASHSCLQQKRQLWLGGVQCAHIGRCPLRKKKMSLAKHLTFNFIFPKHRKVM